jgi:hypothetical protein
MRIALFIYKANWPFGQQVARASVAAVLRPAIGQTK